MNEFPIITKLGGRRAVFERLRAPCNLQTPHALRMWARRGSIPSDAMRELIDIAVSEGLPVDGDDFRLPREAAE